MEPGTAALESASAAKEEKELVEEEEEELVEEVEEELDSAVWEDGCGTAAAEEVWTLVIAAGR